MSYKNEQLSMDRNLGDLLEYLRTIDSLYGYVDRDFVARLGEVAGLEGLRESLQPL